jgi:hypothetical protein
LKDVDGAVMRLSPFLLLLPPKVSQFCPEEVAAIQIRIGRSMFFFIVENI